MRRMLHILKWIGLSLSTLLLAGILVLWVRSLGHEEGWLFKRFEPRPERTAPDLAGKGIKRVSAARVIDGRLWLESSTWAAVRPSEPRTDYRRQPISAARADQDFDVSFPVGPQPWGDPNAQGWRFAGAGFLKSRTAVDPRLGQRPFASYRLALPLWMPTVLFGLWPLLFTIVRLLRKKRRAPGHCPHCGYDLRATPDPAGQLLPRCPECGREAVGAVPH